MQPDQSTTQQPGGSDAAGSEGNTSPSQGIRGDESIPPSDACDFSASDTPISTSNRPAALQAFSQASQYAIRALTHFAQFHGGDYLLGKQVAEDLGIPAPFLSKILRRLVNDGILESQRGRGGGFRLCVPPSEVSIGSIVQVLEDPAEVRSCVLGQARCTDERACPMHVVWQRETDEWTNHLRRTTLEDMLNFCTDKPASQYPRQM